MPLKLCRDLPITSHMDLLIVDGFVDLDPSGRPGLGAHAHAAFEVPIIGVAKSAFRSATHAIRAVNPGRLLAGDSDVPQLLGTEVEGWPRAS